MKKLNLPSGGYSQRVKSLLMSQTETSYFWKGYPFPMLAMELFTKERKGKNN